MKKKKKLFFFIYLLQSARENKTHLHTKHQITSEMDKRDETRCDGKPNQTTFFWQEKLLYRPFHNSYYNITSFGSLSFSLYIIMYTHIYSCCCCCLVGSFLCVTDVLCDIRQRQDFSPGSFIRHHVCKRYNSAVCIFKNNFHGEFSNRTWFLLN
jgi:hypothetical protein